MILILTVEDFYHFRKPTEKKEKTSRFWLRRLFFELPMNYIDLAVSITSLVEMTVSWLSKIYDRRAPTNVITGVSYNPYKWPYK